MLPRRRASAREASARRLYHQYEIEELLRQASIAAWPLDVPTFRREWIDGALERARRIPGLVIDVPVPWWSRLRATPWPDTLSVTLEEWPAPAGGPIRLYVICASSDSPAALVSNLLLGVRVAGGRFDELVKSLETKGMQGLAYIHAVACIPGSVKG